MSSSRSFRLLDLCCGGGGMSVGYARAGFEVVGVDLNEQPGYPFEFWHMSAMAINYEQLDLFDAIHASPPCQNYTTITAAARKRGKVYPDIYREVKTMLVASGKPYIIENVPGSPAKGIGLCGTMFGLGVFRHRLFESNIPLVLPDQPCTCKSKRIGDEYVTVAGDSSTKIAGLKAMGIDWMPLKRQLVEAMPPAYGEFIGRQLMSYLEQQESERSPLMLHRNVRGAGVLVTQPPLF
jgi:DNA (cytosine-5)-methyltransferase 1